MVKAAFYAIDEELEDACGYAEMALEFRETDRSLADAVEGISMDEMRHASILHAEAERIITQYKAQHGEPPAAMEAVYNYLHEKQVKKAARVRALQGMFKE